MALEFIYSKTIESGRKLILPRSANIYVLDLSEEVISFYHSNPVNISSKLNTWKVPLNAREMEFVFRDDKIGKILYSIFEALYLLEKGKIEITYKKKKLKFDQLLAEAREKDKNVKTKYIVFRNMRDRGFIIKTALKFGADFRVYDRGVKPGQDHARWILYPVSESTSLTWHDFSAKNRVAHSTKKNLLIGIVDEEEDVTYYEVKWIKP